MISFIFTKFIRARKLFEVTSLVLLILTIGCLNNDLNNQDTELVVFAASSLTDVYTEISRSFMENHPGVRVHMNYAGSQKLMTQISHGAEADVFISADINQITKLHDLGLTDTDPIEFATNKLAIIVNKNNGGRIEHLQDLALEDCKIVLGHPSVPIGTYTRLLLENISNSNTIPNRDYTQLVQDNVVSYEDSVKSVVMKTILGEADVGIVYMSDTKLAQVRSNTYMIDIPDELNVSGEYAAVSINSRPNEHYSDLFLKFIQTKPAKTTLNHHGFVTP